MNLKNIYIFMTTSPLRLFRVNGNKKKKKKKD